MTCLRLCMVYKGTGLDWMLKQPPQVISRLSAVTTKLLSEMRTQEDD